MLAVEHAVKTSMTKDNDAQARARSQRPAFSIAIWRVISTPYLEILVCLEYNVARTVARKGGGKPADRKSDCPGVSTCLRGCFTCHWATHDRHTGARLRLCNIAHAHPYPQGFVAFGLDRLSPIGTQTTGPSQSPGPCH
jgi:hypothetical protein